MGEKRVRQFLVERRTLRSSLGRVLGLEDSSWTTVRVYLALEPARRDEAVLSERDSCAAGFITRGVQYRISRRDRQAGSGGK